MDNMELDIDFYKLDKHLEEQPSMFGCIAEQYVLAVDNRDNIKNELLRYDASLDSKIRQDAITFGQKLTEKNIMSKIILDEKHSKLELILLEATKKVNMLGAKKTALEYRKKSLEGLVQLYIADWFSEVNSKVDKEKRDSFTSLKADNQQKENLDKTTKTIKRRRKAITQ